MIQKSPTVLKDLAAKHNLDVLCLQETKLQEQHLTDPKLNIVETIGMADDYDDFWACSTAKKGYSGTAVFVKKQNEGGTAGAQKPTKKKTQGTLDSFLSASPESKAKNNRPEPTTSLSEPPLPIDATLLVPTNVSFAMGMEKHDLEGRIVVVDYPLFTLCNVYVPNAGQKLERLSYRTEDWDKDFVQFMQQKQAERGLPVLWLGDLNIAHTNLEVWNDGAKHLAKQAGVTSEERASFGQQLETGGFVDAFRYLHSKAAGHYSYWSMRAGNRAPNKGLRLDYFVCDPILCQETSNVIIRDSYMDHEQGGSDHCPVILELEIKNIKLN